MSKLRVLDLFSGIGGFSLGLERTGGFETVAFCEIEPFPRKVLAKHWPEVPIYDDVRTLTAERLAADGIGTVEVICGGYPCQPFSTAGKRMGDKDDRHLWPEVHRLLDECGPDWFIGENVTGHISMGLDQVLTDLEAIGYTARTFVIPACAVDAPHRRDRTWILANASGRRFSQSPEGEVEFQRGAKAKCGGKVIPHAKGNRWEQGEQISGGRIEGTQARKERRSWDGMQTMADPNGKRGCSRAPDRENAKDAWKSSGSAGRNGKGVATWLPEPGVGRVANGVPGRVDRLKALGNAVVPQIPELIGHAILESIAA